MINEYLETLNGLDDLFKWGIAALTALFILMISNVIMRKYVLTAIQKTKAQWDDVLYWPTRKRLNIFIMVVSLHFAMIWIYGDGDELLGSLMPYISSAYILLAA